MKTNTTNTWCRALRLATLALLLTVATPLLAQKPITFTPLPDRISDSVVTGDLQRFAVMAEESRRSGALRRASYIGLAREAYERNDAGTVTTLMLAVADGQVAVPRTKRAALWSLLDSTRTSPEYAHADGVLVADLETALVRSQYPVLGAPNCEAWESEADRLALLIRGRRAEPVPVIVEIAVIPPPPVIAPPAPIIIAPEAPPELHGIPSMVHFALDRSFLAPASRAVLDVLVDSLQRFPKVRIVLEGHTDLRASVDYNLALSRRRTMSVRAYLMAKGVQEARISIVAQGKSRLETEGVGLTDHARNRRVQLRYYAPDGREIEAMQLLDDLQLESTRLRIPARVRRP